MIDESLKIYRDKVVRQVSKVEDIIGSKKLFAQKSLGILCDSDLGKAVFAEQKK
jgi:hypothetical protein